MSYQNHPLPHPSSIPLLIPSSMPMYNPVSRSNTAGPGPPPSTLHRRPITEPTTPSSLSPYGLQGQTGLPLLPPPLPPPPFRRPRTHHTYGERESASSCYDPHSSRSATQGGYAHGQFHRPGPELGIYPTTSQSFESRYTGQDIPHDGSGSVTGGSRSSLSTDTAIISSSHFFSYPNPNHRSRFNSPTEKGGPSSKKGSMGSSQGRGRERSSPVPASRGRIQSKVVVEEADERGVGKSIDETNMPDKVDVHDDTIRLQQILETYRSLQSRLPDILAKFKLGSEKHGPVTKALSPGDDGYLSSAEMEQEELRQVLKLATDGFRMVGSIYGRDRMAGGERSAMESKVGSLTVDLAGTSDPAAQERRSSDSINEVKPMVKQNNLAPPVPSSSIPSSITLRSGMDPAPTLSSSNSESTISLASGRQRSNDIPRSSNKLDRGSATVDDRSLSQANEATSVEGAGPSSASSSLNAHGSPVCLGCGATGTPEWRRGPMGPRTLCNACGLVFAKLVRKRAREAAKAQAISKGLIPAKKTRAKKAVARDSIDGSVSQDRSPQENTS